MIDAWCEEAWFLIQDVLALSMRCFNLLFMLLLFLRLLLLLLLLIVLFSSFLRKSLLSRSSLAAGCETDLLLGLPARVVLQPTRPRHRKRLRTR